MHDAPLWRPDATAIANSQLAAFITWLNRERDLRLPLEYPALQAWSLREPEAFWSSLWEFFDVIGKRETSAPVIQRSERFQERRFFPGATLNFAENLLRHRDQHPALVSLREGGERRSVSYAELYTQVCGMAGWLRAQGITEGDRVAGFLPNLPETVVAMLATASIGAIWSSCSPDFGINGVMDRFGQIEPKVLVACDGYRYNDKDCDTRARVGDIAEQIDSLQAVLVVPVLQQQPDISGIPGAVLWSTALTDTAAALEFPALPFDHPLYIMYSSGTTGAPKCIVHGAGGTLLQHLKEHRLLSDLCRDDVFFFFTTCGWMMWNWLISGLASGATLLLYDGSPFADEGRVLLDAIDDEGISVFGVGAKYLSALEKAGHKPRESHRLNTLRCILATGSPLSHESFDYVYRDFKTDLRLSSISGGTDILSCFIGACPILPVYRGELQAAGLGMAVEVWDDAGQAIVAQQGELVCTQAIPCCPVGFWGDDDGSRFQSAYFDTFPGVWAHGDFAEQTAHGGYIIHGRSDAVLNPGGVRIGTAEIYRQVERIDAVLESLVIGQQWQDDVRVVLFVVLREGLTLDPELTACIRREIRDNATPRHVPAKIIAVSDIPRTISGKIVELAVRNVVHGRPVKNTDALANPQALELFRNLAELQS